jgi:competence protein ComFB
VEEKLQNLMEPLVLMKLDEVIDKLDCCKCEKCRMDMVSYALNRLPPKYVATSWGQAYSKLNMYSLQYETDMLNALFQAAKIVSENPRHSCSTTA